MKKNTVRLSAMLFILSLAVGTASAQTTITVTTWAELLAAAPVSGDTVVLAAGTYTANSPYNMVEGVVYRGAGDTTIIDCGGGGRMLQAPMEGVNPPVTDSVGTWTLESVKITNVGSQHAFRAYATDSNPSGTGELFSPQTVNITNVTFENITATANGGGAQFRKGVVTFTDCTFTNIASDNHGAGIFGGTQGDTTLNVIGCTFTNCKAQRPADGRDGGAIMMQSANNTLNVTNCLFTDCDALDDGFAIKKDNGGVVNVTGCSFTGCDGVDGTIWQNGGTLTVTDCSFTDCTGDDGAGVFHEGAGSISFINDCVFTNCDTTDDGGGVFLNGLDSEATITGSSFENCDGEDGGAVYAETTDFRLVSLSDCTFTNNTSTEDGGAFHVGSSMPVIIDGCTFDGNRNIGDGSVETSEGAHINIDGVSSLELTDSIFLNGSTLHRNGAINMGSDSAITCHISNCLIAGNQSPGPFTVLMKGDDIKLINNTIVGNTVGDTTEGIVRLYTDAEVTGLVISNNIFMNNSGADNVVRYWTLVNNPINAALAGPLSTISNNCFFGNTLTNGSTVLVEGSWVDGGTFFIERSRITDDPALDADHKPTSASTAIINAADVAQATASDLEGVLAIGVRDVGAYEYVVAPLAPTNLTASPGNTMVSLQWDAVAGASGYRVYQSETSGGPYTTTDTLTTALTNLTVMGLTNGTTYYFVVRAFNNAGESGNSTQAEATPDENISLGARDWHLYR
jgi:predicted outer membrane repeat protein